MNAPNTVHDSHDNAFPRQSFIDEYNVEERLAELLPRSGDSWKQLEKAMNSVISGADSRIPLLFLMIVHDLTDNASV